MAEIWALLTVILSFILSSSQPLTAPPPTNTLIATGDVMPGRSVNIQTIKQNNFLWPWEKVAETLKSADLTLINLESPLVANCPQASEGFKFCGDQRHIEGLKFAGVDIANIANNHATNYGIEGLNQTINLLQENGISVSGHSGPVYKESRGVRFAFLGYNQVGRPEPAISWADEELISQEIAQAKQKSDVIIVSFHWGNEYTTTITETQKRLAHLSIDSGADLVIGHHPHWVQPHEYYKDKLIVYSHGNFIFDQMWSQKTREGIVGKYTFSGNQLINAEFLPILIENFGQPRFVTSSP